jgi:hypothetical protein
LAKVKAISCAAVARLADVVAGDGDGVPARHLVALQNAKMSVISRRLGLGG